MHLHPRNTIKRYFLSSSATQQRSLNQEPASEPLSASATGSSNSNSNSDRANEAKCTEGEIGTVGLASISKMLVRSELIPLDIRSELLALVGKIHEDDCDLESYRMLACKLCEIITADSTIACSSGKGSVANPNATDLCRICFSGQIDCVLIPCGHLAVCTHCARRLDCCPFDRIKIQRLHPVYRV